MQRLTADRRPAYPAGACSAKAASPRAGRTSSAPKPVADRLGPAVHDSSRGRQPARVELDATRCRPTRLARAAASSVAPRAARALDEPASPPPSSSRPRSARPARLLGPEPQHLARRPAAATRRRRRARASALAGAREVEPHAVRRLERERAAVDSRRPAERIGDAVAKRRLAAARWRRARARPACAWRRGRRRRRRSPRRQPRCRVHAARAPRSSDGRRQPLDRSRAARASVMPLAASGAACGTREPRRIERAGNRDARDTRRCTSDAATAPRRSSTRARPRHALRLRSQPR